VESSDRAKEAFIGAALVATLLAAPAVAADLPVRTPPPVVEPLSSWTGFYIGSGIDARFNAVDGNVTSATAGNTPIPLPPVSHPDSAWWAFWAKGPGAMAYVDNISIGLKLHGGWNYQVSPRWVVGVEADFNYANEQATVHGSPYPANLLFGTPITPFGATHNDEFKVRTRWDASARVRTGWLATPSMLLYLTAGLAWANIEVISTCSTTLMPNVSNCAPGNYFGGTLGPGDIAHSATKLGWTGGGGAEWMFAPNWIARWQYRFADFGFTGPFSPFSFSDTRFCTGCPAGLNPLSVSYEVPMMQHHFELGISYKFGP
jgi:outer membrane immunogenic protein